MDKAGLLRTIAETGYNVGFGAKKTFATFDIVEKGPGWIGFVSLAVGVYALYVDALAAKFPSATLVVAGIGALYISFYRSGEYEKAGNEQIRLFHRLRDLYREVESGADVTASRAKLAQIEGEFYAVTISKQIFLSDWYAHYKFFAQSQIGWMDEQLHFQWWKDKIPLSAKVVIVAAALALVGALVTTLVRAECFA
ncbi:SLATT domain-containing protein [Sphingomonas koreensis]